MRSMYPVKSKIKGVCKRLILKANCVLNRYREIIWLLGDGRSGTTWVCNLINYDKRYREMFEPFHPEFVDDIKFMKPHQYIRPYELDERIRRFSKKVFSGRFTHERVDAANHSLLYKGIVIKDIFANLLSYAVWLQFPKVKPVLLLRNPFAVALSKLKKSSWFWVTDPLDLLNQKDLYDDYLFRFEDLIRKVSVKGEYILNQILIWSVINYIPLRQFGIGSLHVCFYEKIFTDPQKEMKRIFSFVKGVSDIDVDEVKFTEVVNRPSRVSGKESTLLAGTSPITSWKDEIPPHIIDEGLDILQHFGFEDLYDEDSMPDEDVIRRIQLSAQGSAG